MKRQATAFSCDMTAVRKAIEFMTFNPRKLSSSEVWCSMKIGLRIGNAGKLKHSQYLLSWEMMCMVLICRKIQIMKLKLKLLRVPNEF